MKVMKIKLKLRRLQLSPHWISTSTADKKTKTKNKHQAHSHTDKLAKSTSREQHYRERSLWRESQRAQKKLTAKHKHGE